MKIQPVVRRFWQSAVLLVLAVASQSVSAQSLTTTFASNNGCAGNYFDLEVIGPSPVTLTSFDVNINPGTHDVAVYWRPGTSSGSEGSADGWLLLGSQDNVASNGNDVPTPVAIGGLTLQPGQTYGLLVGTTNGNEINYTNGANVYSDANLELTTSVSVCDPLLTGGLNSPRTWNGTVYYSFDAIEPAEGTAVIAVDKTFIDGNDETEVTLTLQCSGGTYAPASVTVLPDDNKIEHIFVIDAIPEGAPNICTVVEEPVDGYETFYLCPQGVSASDVNPDLCASGDVEKPLGTSACGWLDVQEGDVNRCYINNAPAPVDVEVTKVWEMAGAEQSEVDTDVRITLFCDAEIVGGSKDNGDTWMRSKDITDYTDEDGEYVGEGSAAFEVIPNWFPTSATPEEQEFTECWAVENVQDNAVEVVSDCGSEESPGIEVAVGTGGSCTITNTVFFEGIPTLSQYGVVLMALIMLGVGFIGMRRYA